MHTLYLNKTFKRRNWIILAYSLTFLIPSTLAQRTTNAECENSKCNPAIGDLLIGRESQLSATSTCGFTKPERYCILSHLEDQKNKCYVCDSRRPFSGSNRNSHKIENIISRFRRDWKTRWWQAENGMQNVSIRLDLEAEFHFTHLIMKFKTFRPAAMLIERSFDFGKTWKVYRYFSSNCAESFPGISTGPVIDMQTVICESKYSEVAPSSEGEVIFRVLPQTIIIPDPYHEQVQDLIKITNLRVNLTKLHTLGDNLLDRRSDVKDKYYYAVYNIVVRGSCSCYGHASVCTPLLGKENTTNMVHGRCVCSHFTKGLNCEQCQDFYNDLPWRPAHGQNTNACKVCNCNNHSDMCHFDPAVYEATNRVSGGVCDDCQHNTMGRNCEECKPFFYHDTSRSIDDSYACQSCDCDPLGSLEEGACELKSDPYLGTIAGKCNCKLFVEGERCDRCKHGYWNLSMENPDGCQACGCNPIGTIYDDTCDALTGDCFCKRYVEGRQCDSCQPGYWNLSEDPQGCLACDCDVGGSIVNDCSQQYGQCTCRSNLIDLRCKEASDNHFVPSLDWLIYEGEFARPEGPASQLLRYYDDPNSITWTGPGFMQVYEGSSIEFTVDDIPFSTSYDIVVRYEAADPWDDVRLNIIRTEPIDLEGPCANKFILDENNPLLIFTEKRHYTVSPTTCLEKGQSYKIKIDFLKASYEDSRPDASLLIDSIVLLPNTKDHPLMQESHPRNILDEFERYRCIESFDSISPNRQIYEACKPLIYSASVFLYDGARACNCDPIGSLSAKCEFLGGQCQCKPNVAGRRCNECAPGTFGFGESGCTACECSQLGSQNSFCDLHTGQCECVPNAFGPTCGECQRGFFGYPHCIPCQCNGMTDDCESLTGRCINCRDNSGGHDCTDCADGFYGNPRPHLGGCKPCLCPGGAGSNMQHADTCSLRLPYNQVICDCKPSFAGISCEKCAMNYFGNPLIPGGSCKRCECNNNIDHSEPDSCDAETGQCQKCLYNTAGNDCERCVDGYFGDATVQACIKCSCNILGTIRTMMTTCDHITGQCHCLASVEGQNCDRCSKNHWKLASGMGCEHCNCDPIGSLSDQCNEFFGQCECREGYGGRDCSQCPSLYWGSPMTECYPCDCNIEGSYNNQCNKTNGQCDCAVGVTGLKCDRCDRGTTGTLPFCLPCGECFNNWDKIIANLRIETESLIKKGTDIKQNGVPTSFDAEFEQLDNKIKNIREITNNTNIEKDQIVEIEETLKQYRDHFTNYQDIFNDIDSKLSIRENDNQELNIGMDNVFAKYNKLKNDAEKMKEDATKVQEMDVDGASKSIVESSYKSYELDNKVEHSQQVLVRRNASLNSFDMLFDDIEKKKNESQQAPSIDHLVEKLDMLANKTLIELGIELCDGQGDHCDNSCGGAGCGKCGGEPDCEKGTVTISQDALNNAKQADELIKLKHKQFENTSIELRLAKKQCSNADHTTNMLHKKAEEILNFTKSKLNDSDGSIKTIEDYLDKHGSEENKIEEIAKEIDQITISLTSEEIVELGDEIKNTMQSLTNIDEILEKTRGELQKASYFKDQANSSRLNAVDELEFVKNISSNLKQIKEAHTSADEEMKELIRNLEIMKSDINSAEDNMLMIEHNSTAQIKKLEEFNERIVAMKAIKNNNDLLLQQVDRNIEEADEFTEKTKNESKTLENSYNKFSGQLNDLLNKTNYVKENIGPFKTSVTEFVKILEDKSKTLNDIGKEISEKQRTVDNYQRIVQELTTQVQFFIDKIAFSNKFHQTC